MDIAKIMIPIVIIAAVFTLIAFAATYWYYFVGIGAVAFGIYAFNKKKQDERNKV